MRRSIRVSDTTKQILHRIKEEEHALSYDEVIQSLVKKKSKIPASLSGTAKGMAWKKGDRMDFHE